MPGQKLSDYIIDDIRRQPTKDVLDKLGIPVRRGSLISCPYRPDRNPSWSIFKGRGGVWLWHDFSTGESGDNISLYRKLFPEYRYDEAVDHLSYLLFNRTAYEASTYSQSQPKRQPKMYYASAPATEKEGALKVVRNLPLTSPDVPDFLVNYWRCRGISDITAQTYCSYVVIENANRKGRELYDKVSGLPLVGRDGSHFLDDGLTEAIGMSTDIGGTVFRAPDVDGRKGFKGSTESFISTFFANGARPLQNIKLVGQGDNRVHFVRYYPGNWSLQFNPTQWFSGISPAVSSVAINFLRGFDTQVLSEKELRAVSSVLSAINGPLNGSVDVGEGFFDIPLSSCEMRKMKGYNVSPGHDLVCLNGIGNIKWAVPFLSCHRVVNIYLDNDMKSHAGEKACEDLQKRIESFSKSCGLSPVVRNCSNVFYPEKDLNDYLKTAKGFPSSMSKADDTKVKKTRGKSCSPSL